MSDLKRCPFCGGSNVNLKYVGNDRTKSRKVIIKCADCRFTRTDAAIRHNHDWLTEVITKAWNTRPVEDALKAENQQLRDAIVKAWSVLRVENWREDDYDDVSDDWEAWLDAYECAVDEAWTALDTALHPDTQENKSHDTEN